MNRCLLFFLSALPSLLSGCFVVEHELRETVAINGNKLPGSSIPPGQLVNVALIDGTVFSATFVELSKAELVTRRRGTLAMEDVHTPLPKVSALSYSHVIGTRTERVRMLPALPSDIPLPPPDMSGLVPVR